MSQTPLERLKNATRQREALRKTWDERRNLDLLNLLRVSIPAMFHCERFGLFVRELQSDSLWIETGTGVVERSIVVTASGSMLGEALEARRPIRRADLLDGSGVHQLVGDEQGFRPKNALTVPVFNPEDGSAIGALQVLNKINATEWTEDDAVLLQNVAHSIAGSVALMQSGQHLLTQARSLDSTIARLSQMESAIRGSHMLRTFEPASEIPEGGFLHHRFQGTMFPPFIDRNANVDLSESWDTDPNDIFICTHQKVGTHLIKKFLVELVRHFGDLPEDNVYATGDIGGDTVPWPSVMYSQHGRAVWEHHLARTHNQPRIWYIHAGYDDLPVRRIHPETKFVVVCRDPRAVAVSQYFFYKRHPLLSVPDDLDLDRFVEQFVDGDLYFGDYHRHVMGWLYRKDQRISSEQLLALKYEDLVENKLACAKILLDFLQLPTDVPVEDLERVAQSTEFSKMKKEISDNPQSFHLNPKVYFRSGTVNDWEHHLSHVAVDAINAKTNELWGADVSQPPMVNIRTIE